MSQEIIYDENGKNDKDVAYYYSLKNWTSSIGLSRIQHSPGPVRIKELIAILKRSTSVNWPVPSPIGEPN